MAQPANTAKNSDQLPKPLLPARISGWTEAGAPKVGTTAAEADAANAGALDEYGLKEFATGVYRHGNGRMELRAMRFADATGAYGAFTLYRQPGMKPQAIGDRGAGDAHETVFWSGATLIDAKFDHPAANEESALKTLASELPPTTGSTDVAPTLPQYLPSAGLDESTIHYAIGPAAYAKSGGTLPAGLLGFNRDAEVVTAQYAHGDQHETLTLVEYPTPQMAITGEQALNGALQRSISSNMQQSGGNAFFIRRTGPIVAVADGSFPSGDAHALLAQIKYQAEVTWNRPNNAGGEVRNAANMLLGIAYLTAILGACALLLGFFLGGGRAVWRVLHGKPASTLYEEDFISLNLNEWQSGRAEKLH